MTRKGLAKKDAVILRLDRGIQQTNVCRAKRV
mgnify:CR=1 FL=1